MITPASAGQDRTGQVKDSKGKTEQGKTEQGGAKDFFLKKEAKTSAPLRGRAPPRYTMAELLATSDYAQPQPPDEREWIDTPAVGREPL